MSRLRLLLPALLVFAALFLVACDGDMAENNDYVDEVNEVQNTLQTEIGALAQTPESPDQLVTFYEDTKAKLEEAVAKLEEIEPPEDLGELHDELVAEVQGLADLITGAVDEIRQGGAAAIPGAVQQLATEGSRIQSEFSATIDEINSKLQE